MGDEALDAAERAELEAFRAARAEQEAADERVAGEAVKAAEAEAKTIADAEAVVAAEQAELAARRAHPGRFVGVDTSESGTYVYEDAPGDAFQRELHSGGVPYHHVAEDGDGVWLYRRGA